MSRIVWTAAVPGVLAVGAVVAASVVELPSASAPDVPEPHTVQVAPAVQPAVCPGPLEIPVGEIESGDEDLDSGSDDRVLWMSAPSLFEVGQGVAADATVVTQTERVGGGDIESLAALTCAPPVQDQWIVAGSTALGSSSRLVLSNPSQASVRVTVSLYGPLAFEGRETISMAVGPRSQHEVLLEAIEPEVPGLAMRVEAGGVGIVAALQDSRLDGFVAAGTDWGTRAAYGTDIAIPIAGPVSDETPGTLRLISPYDASVQVSLIDESGAQRWLDDQALELEAGLVTDVAIPAQSGAAITVTSDVPVAAAALTRTSYERGDEDDTGTDMAWTPAQQADDDTARAVVVPEGEVTVVAVATSTGRLVLTDVDGEPVVDEAMRPDTYREFSIDVPAGTTLTGSDDITWALRVTDDGYVTTVTPRPVEREPHDVSVAHGSYTGADHP